MHAPPCGRPAARRGAPVPGPSPRSGERVRLARLLSSVAGLIASRRFGVAAVIHRRLPSVPEPAPVLLERARPGATAPPRVRLFPEPARAGSTSCSLRFRFQNLSPFGPLPMPTHVLRRVAALPPGAARLAPALLPPSPAPGPSTRAVSLSVSRWHCAALTRLAAALRTTDATGPAQQDSAAAACPACTCACQA